MSSQPENDLTKLNLTEMFNESAQRYYTAFPDRFKKLVIAFTQQDIFASPDMADMLTQQQQQTIKMLQDSYTFMQQSQMAALAVTQTMEDTEFNLLAFENSALLTGRNFPPELEQIYFFDHEIGHFVVSGETNDGKLHMTKCIADAFASLRMIQRFDNIQAFLENKMIDLAATAVREYPPAPYTSNIIQKVLNLHRDWTEKGEGTDIRALSLEATAELARSIATTYHIPSPVLYKMGSAFLPVYKRTLETNGGDPNATEAWHKVLQELVSAMDTHKANTEFYRAAKLFLQHRVMKDALDRMTEQDRTALSAKLEKFEQESGFVMNAPDLIDGKTKLTPATQPKKSLFKRIFSWKK